MIRVGFRPFGWQGGQNYLWNLLHAVTSLPSRRIQPVLLLRPGQEAGDLAQPGIEQHTTGGLDTPRLRSAGRLVELVIGRDPIERYWLRRSRIDLLSHATPVGGDLPTVGWIPDLQPHHLPHMFSRRERLLRELDIRDLLRGAALIVTSSESARDDMQKFYGAGSRCRVLRFVSQPRVAVDRLVPLAELRARHEIPPRYIHLPNQLWKHKNHALVIEALREARDVAIVATGPREDYRHPGVWEDLQAHIRTARVGNRFFHLGLVSFLDVISLMYHAVAVVNPSRFEGWSTTVEEAKSLGKRVLVSDIAVHREQAPARASYFGVDDASGLAELLAEVWATHDPEEDRRAAATAAALLPQRTREFALRYEEIVLEASSRNSLEHKK